MFRSQDAGKTLELLPRSMVITTDWWIDPRNPQPHDHGNDGGAAVHG